jgi:hypothetical protein
VQQLAFLLQNNKENIELVVTRVTLVESATVSIYIKLPHTTEDIHRITEAIIFIILVLTGRSLFLNLWFTHNLHPGD